MSKKLWFSLIIIIGTFVYAGSELSLKTNAETNSSVNVPTEVNVNTPANSPAMLNNDRFIISSKGKASYYATKFHNRKTASGERFDLYGMTAAHKKLPFGTIVKVQNQKNDAAILVRINDRGPFIKGRIIDLSYRGAKAINGLGTPNVVVDYFDNEAVIKSLDSSYYLGYSVNNPFLIIKKEFISTIAIATDFEEAINLYHVATDEYPIDCYLFVKADKTQRQCEYLIGHVNAHAVAKYNS